MTLETMDTDYLCIREQTTLLEKRSRDKADYDAFCEVVHFSNVTANIQKDSVKTK